MAGAMAVGDIRPRRAARSHPADRVIADIAAAQHGVVARRQLLARSLSRHEIQSRLRSGRLHSFHLGVYAAGHNRLTQRGRWMAAVLACGEGATLSHRSAAALWGIAEVPDTRVEVIVPRNRASRHRGNRASIAIHGTRELPDEQRTVRYSIPVTTVSRTLLDLAGSVAPARLRRAFEAADRLELLDLRGLVGLCESARCHAGTGRLRALAAEHLALPETRSELERRFLRLCERAALPRPAVNVVVAGFEVDCFWPSRRLVVELDGYQFHHDRASFERDRRRDAALQVAGHTVVRVTHTRLVGEEASIVAELEKLLGLPRSASR
jgi:very-short-patch-repair endonuclease